MGEYRGKQAGFLPFAWFDLGSTVHKVFDLECEFSSFHQLKVYGSALTEMKC